MAGSSVCGSLSQAKTSSRAFFGVPEVSDDVLPADDPQADRPKTAASSSPSDSSAMSATDDERSVLLMATPSVDSGCSRIRAPRTSQNSNLLLPTE